MDIRKLSLWTVSWFFIIILLTLFPLVWYIYERFIKGSTLLYESGMTFILFFGLAGISLLIWGIGVLVKLGIKKSKNN